MFEAVPECRYQPIHGDVSPEGKNQIALGRRSFIWLTGSLAAVKGQR
jgi:hypothetical protein